MTIHPLQVEPLTLIDRLRASRLPPPHERRALRRAAGAKLRDVSAELKVSDAAVSCWERGLYEPGPRHAAAYLRLLEGFATLAREAAAAQSQK
jgi:DNA-binding transcriptional regulator YiaG